MSDERGAGDEASKGLVNRSLTGAMNVRKRWLAPKVIISDVGMTRGTIQFQTYPDGAPQRGSRRSVS
jgi:hypothetical protein